MTIIDEFEKEYFFLSNFYRCPVYFDNITYTSSECAYQAQKTLDIELRKKIATLTPRQIWEGTAPRGNKYNFEQRKDWEEVKDISMYNVVLAKFSQNTDLGKKLLETKDAILIEGTTWHDNYWGNCTCEKCKNIVGRNQLGKILMRVRGELGGAFCDEELNININKKYGTSIVNGILKPPCINL